MDKWTAQPIRSSEITPEWAYLNRRQFMKGAAAVSLGALLAACAPPLAGPSAAPQS
ncbi:MAG: twin-arginine translocation signal domain-containing protein, partial [Chloroflexi bacterium]|nr:twin-arginine translocation signal domain-containing protein [Chloroflexota bacterium]